MQMGGVKPESKNSRRFMMPRDPPDTLHSTEGTAFQPLRKYTQITVKICKMSKTCVCVHAQSARLSAIPWTIQHTRLLRPWDFPQAEYKDGLLFPPPGYLPKPGTKPESPAAPALAGGFFITEPPRKSLMQGQSSQSHSVVSDSCDPMDSPAREPARFLCPSDSPGENTGVGCLFLPGIQTEKRCTEAQLGLKRNGLNGKELYFRKS